MASRKANVGSPDNDWLMEWSDSGTQTEYEWDDEEKRIIQQHHDYHCCMLRYIEEVAKNGPSASIAPKRPKQPLSSVLANTPQRGTKLTGRKLHEYLVVHCVTNMQVPTGDQTPTSLVEMGPLLKAGYHNLMGLNANSLQRSLVLGRQLGVAREVFDLEKSMGNITYPWKDWLSMNVGIGDRYARQLMEVARSLEGFTRFNTLGLSFSEIYQRRHMIRHMLLSDPEVAIYWK